MVSKFAKKFSKWNQSFDMKWCEFFFLFFFVLVAPFASPNRQYLPPQQQSGQPSNQYGPPNQGGSQPSSQYGPPNQGGSGGFGGNQGGFGGSGGFGGGSGQQPSQSYGTPSQGKITDCIIYFQIIDHSK